MKLKPSTWIVSSVVIGATALFGLQAKSAGGNSWVFDGGDAAILNILTRSWNGTDGLTTISSSDRLAQNDGALFYVPRYAYDTVNPLYRLILGSDYMDSMSADEGGYQSNANLGYPYPSSSTFAGLAPIVRGYNASTGDHILQKDDESISGYSKQALSVYGWPRYNNVAESMLVLKSSGVSIEANKVAGCAIWRWTWNGKQLLNNGTDYGRQMQTSIGWVDSSGNQTNPTEAGDIYTGYQLAPSARHGAPCIAGSVTDNKLHTETVPLEWNAGSLVGAQGGPDNPVIWKNLKIAKDVELNYQNLGAAALYTTRITMARAVKEGTVEIPTAYLSPELKSIYTYEAKTDALAAVSVPASMSDYLTYVPANGFGGVIASTPSGDYALGIYGSTPAQGGSVSKFVVYNFIILNNGDTSEMSNDTIKLGANYSGALAAGENVFTTVVISGTLADVRAKMKAVYTAGLAPEPTPTPSPTVTPSPSPSPTEPVETAPVRTSLVFDVEYYLALYADLRAAFGATGYSKALDHYNTYGINEGRRSSLEFDVAYYIKYYPDVALLYKTSTGYNYKGATDHFLNLGIKLGRRGSADFDVKAYLARYADLRAAFGSKGYTAAYNHWLTYGKAEGRKGSP